MGQTVWEKGFHCFQPAHPQEKQEKQEKPEAATSTSDTGADATDARHDAGVVVETRILSVNNNRTSAEKPAIQTRQSTGESGNFTVHMLSNDVTPNKSTDPKVKVVPRPTKAPSKDDFVIHIKSLERVDGKKPFRRSKSKSTTMPSEKRAATTTKGNVQINVWTITEAPQSESKVKPSRLEYDNGPWANDWGAELSYLT